MSINDWNAVEKKGVNGETTVILEPGLGPDEPETPVPPATMAQLEAAKAAVELRTEELTEKERELRAKEQDIERRERELNERLKAL